MDQAPTYQPAGGADELTARIAAGASRRLHPESNETWLNRWAPYPAGVRRGPYATPTRTNLTTTAAGLERLLAVIRSEETTTAPAVQMPALEPVPVDGCVICKAAVNGRTSARARGATGAVAAFNRIVEEHPHRRESGWKGADRPEGAELAPRSALRFPPCTCGHPVCPDKKTPVADAQAEHERAADGDSETLTRLRSRVHEDNTRRQQFGPLGRSL
ncbi:hypothetical protein ACWDBF_17070 [Streptomyces angustmyceticus]